MTADNHAPEVTPTVGDEQRAIPPPEDLADTAIAPDYDALRGYAERAGPQFWLMIARELQWESYPTETPRSAGTTAHWFADGIGNLTINCLDRHLHESRRDKTAILWRGAHAEERRLTYGDLHRLTCKFASSLKELGVATGTPVALSLPPSPESVAALLACARLGALAIPLVAAGEEEIRVQMRATAARLVIAADLPEDGASHASTIARAIAGLVDPPRLIVWHRTRDSAATEAGTIDLGDLLKGASPRCEPLLVGGDDPFVALPAGTGAGNPAYARFAHGGFSVGVSFTTRIAYDLKDETIFCPLGPGDWLAARPALLVGPLLNGATIVLYERPPAPDEWWPALARDGVTTLVAQSELLSAVAARGKSTAAGRQSLRLMIADGTPLSEVDWWKLYRDRLHERAHFCASWWEPAFGAPVIGTLPSMVAYPGWLGRALPGIATTLEEEPEDGGRARLQFIESWPHLAQGVDPSSVDRPVRRSDAGYLTIAADN